ncbi:hypothetical protein T492DRAFT_874004 [Pavlovales sp. CCMP2436]|nr:hypothetical protein T492DRAFT_874004 [Pavlovales sp. CCMP2436]
MSGESGPQRTSYATSGRGLEHGGMSGASGPQRTSGPRYARGPDGKTRGFYPGWMQERRLLRSVKLNMALQAAQQHARTFPSPPLPPLRSELDVVATPKSTPTRPLQPPQRLVCVDPETGEEFVLDNWAMGAGAQVSGAVAIVREMQPPRLTMRARTAHAAAAAAPPHAAITSELRTMRGPSTVFPTAPAPQTAVAAPRQPPPPTSLPTNLPRSAIAPRSEVRGSSFAKPKDAPGSWYSAAEIRRSAAGAPTRHAAEPQASAADLSAQLRALCGIGTGGSAPPPPGSAPGAPPPLSEAQQKWAYPQPPGFPPGAEQTHSSMQLKMMLGIGYSLASAAKPRLAAGFSAAGAGPPGSRQLAAGFSAAGGRASSPPHCPVAEPRLEQS